MSVIATLIVYSVFYLVGALSLWWCVIFRHWRASGRRGGRARCVVIATKVALRWPSVLIEAVIYRSGIEIAEFPVLDDLRVSGSSSRQEVDEVGRVARVLRSREGGPGELVVDFVSEDFILAPDRHSGGVACSVIVDRWTIAQLTPLLDCVVRASPREFSVGSDEYVGVTSYVPRLDDRDLRDARDYLHRLVEVGSPPIHPLVGAALGSLVAASEAGDLAVMSREEVDVVDAVLDFASRGDGDRIARTVALVRSEIPGDRDGDYARHEDGQ